MDGDSDEESDQPNSWSGLPDDCSLKDLRKIQPTRGCKFLNDDSLTRLHYSGDWIVNSSDPTDLSRGYTVHVAPNSGASVSLTFDASNIIVFGLMPPGSFPPQASYVIDDMPRAAPQLNTTTECLLNQQLFNSSTLADVGRPHNLTVLVTQASVDQPYILDHLWLCGPGSQLVQNSTGITGNGNGTWSGRPNSAQAQGTLSVKDVVIIGLASVLGLTTVLALLVYIRLGITRKARRMREPPGSSKASVLLTSKAAKCFPRPWGYSGSDTSSSAHTTEPKESTTYQRLCKPILPGGGGDCTAAGVLPHILLRSYGGARRTTLPFVATANSYYTFYNTNSETGEVEDGTVSPPASTQEDLAFPDCTTASRYDRK
ncbi:hypothetical protein V8D89_002731 [Ganoderma adspersum]